jgi:formate/nitrite transporter FocA (FNT family)
LRWLTPRILWSVPLKYCIWSLTVRFTGAIFLAVCLPTLAGNICGGTFIFALLSHAQIRNDMSNKRKAELKARENDDKSTKKST